MIVFLESLGILTAVLAQLLEWIICLSSWAVWRMTMASVTSLLMQKVKSFGTYLRGMKCAIVQDWDNLCSFGAGVQTAGEVCGDMQVQCTELAVLH